MTPNGGWSDRGSTANHPNGYAMDFVLTRNGSQLPYSDPAYERVISSLKKNATTNIGIGRYPGSGFIHYDETPVNLNKARNKPVSEW